MKTIDSRARNGSGQLMGHPMRKEEEVTGVEFMPPSGLDLKGRKGTATVAWSRKSDGKMVITSVNGVSIGADDEEDDSMEMEDAQAGAEVPAEEMA
ncbi:MAG: hypothetical protein JW395_0515 [Nitrospira sp.]|nr:hypothetical protein [Nitrospira sp.]